MKTEQRLYVEQLKDGRFQYRLRYRDPKTGTLHRVSCIKPSNSRQNYNQALRELQDRVIFAFTDHLRLDAAAKMYLEDKARIVRPQTLDRNRYELKVINRAIGEDFLLEKLDALTLRRALTRISPKNSTYNERLIRYKAFLNWCWQNDLIEDKWFEKIPPLPDAKKERIAEKYLEPAELQLLLSSMKQPMWYYLTYFMCLSGLRIGEAAALTLDDIGDYISVTKNYALNKRAVGPPKTAESERLVYVQPELRALLDEYLVFRAEYLGAHDVESKLLFCSADGGYIGYNAYNKYLKDRSEHVLGRRITTHALRHTSASFLIANGVPLDSISRRLGHSDSKVTKQIYIHQTEKLRELDNSYVATAKLILP